MTTKNAFRIAAAAALIQAASAQALVTLDINPGINWVGLTLHETPEASGTLDSSNATSATDNDVDFDLALGQAGAVGVHVLELDDGVIRETTSWSGFTLDVTDFASVSTPVEYEVRPQATLASVFGPNNESGLEAGDGGSFGADQVWLWNGAGWSKYYYDNFAPPAFTSQTWVDLNAASPVDPTAIAVPYDQAFIVNSSSGIDIYNSGHLKMTPTQLRLNAGLNPACAVFPLDMTLAVAFGAMNEGGLATGAGSAAGADQVWILNGVTLNKYYFDQYGPTTFAPAWVELGGSEVDPATITLPYGYFIYSPAANDIIQGVPSYE